jgi:putative flavoprotein involved in K+ transport
MRAVELPDREIGADVRVGTVVIGGGQAGLTMGYHLKRRLDRSRRERDAFVIVEADGRVGDSWRRRYDSLRLFSHPKYASLPGWPIAVRTCPTRDEMADYLEAYAKRFDLPVRTGVRVQRVSRHEDGFAVETSSGRLLASTVVVASGEYVVPRSPSFAGELDPSVKQLHSIDYRAPAQLAPGGVLVVGAANSGTDVALEAVRAGHRVWLAGRHPGQVPVDIDSPSAKLVLPLVMFAFRHVLTLRTPMGRRARAYHAEHGVNLVRNKLAHLDAAGIERIGRITGVVDGRPVTADGFSPDVRTVVWCTGSTADHSFLDLPVLGADGRPVHDRGVSPEPGLYFIGLEFQFAIASATIQGLDRDARYVLRAMDRWSARSGARAAKMGELAAVS